MTDDDHARRETIASASATGAAGGNRRAINSRRHDVDGDRDPTTENEVANAFARREDRRAAICIPGGNIGREVLERIAL